jgi:hypothetical protein
MGIDPAVALCLRRSDDAASELAAIPDTAALKAADKALLRLDNCNCDEAAAQYHAKIERLAECYRDGRHQPDLVNASPAELLAFYTAFEIQR